MQGFAPALVCCGACFGARRRLDDLALGGRNSIPAAREMLVGHVDSMPMGNVLGAVERFVDVYSGEVAWQWAPVRQYRGHGDPTRPAQATYRPGPPYTLLTDEPVPVVSMRCRSAGHPTYRATPLQLKARAERHYRGAERARQAGEVVEPWFHVGRDWAT